MLHSTHSSPLRGLREEERRGKIERWREQKKKKRKEGESGESDRKMPTETAKKTADMTRKEGKESKKERRRKQRRRMTQWRGEKEKRMFASHLQWRRTA